MFLLGKHHLIFVPGLGDDNLILHWEIKRFENDGFIVHIHPAPWRNQKENLQSKLKRLISLIDKLSNDDDLVSLVGISAGASFVLNAYIQKKNKIAGVVNLFGRLNAGNHTPSLSFASRGNPVFKGSVLRFERSESKLTDTDRKKVLTIRAMLDETVPLATTPLKGAKNIQVPLVEHTLSIFLGILIYRKLITEFLKSCE